MSYAATAKPGQTVKVKLLNGTFAARFLRFASNDLCYVRPTAPTMQSRQWLVETRHITFA